MKTKQAGSKEWELHPATQSGPNTIMTTMITKIKILRFLLSTFAAITCASFTHCLGEVTVSEYENECGFGAQQVKISPKATWVSWVQQVGDKNLLLITPVGELIPQTKAGIKDGKIVDHLWFDENTMIYLWNTIKNERNRLVILNVKTDEETSIPVPAPATIIMPIKRNNVLWVKCDMRNPGVFDIYKVNMEEKKLELKITNEQSMTSYFYDDNGIISFASKTIDDVETIYSVYDGEYTKVFEAAGGDEIGHILPGSNSDHLYLATNAGMDTMSVISLDKKGSRSIVFQHPSYDIYGMLVDKDDNLAAIGLYGEKQEYKFIYEKNNIFKEISERMPEYFVDFASMEEVNKYAILLLRSATDIGRYAIYNIETKEIAPLFPGLPYVILSCKTESFNMVARDGLKLQGYLTYPKETVKPPYPTVVLVHGGPWIRDYMEYDELAQTLAWSGYLVIKVNYRGSTGFGKAFLNAGNKEWGRKMQDDITDAVKWAIGKKIANANNIAIAGMSYGGYAALMGLIREPNLFRCGASVNGPVDICAFLALVPATWQPKKGMADKMVGNPKTDKAYLDAVSPLHLVKNIKSPVLIIQSTNDSLVPKNKTDEFVEFLGEHGAFVEYKEIVDGHSPTNSKNLVDILNSLITFLNIHMKNSDKGQEKAELPACNLPPSKP